MSVVEVMAHDPAASPEPFPSGPGPTADALPGGARVGHSYRSPELIGADG